MCVFSNHCMCSEGFFCEEVYPGLSEDAKECANGSTCIEDITWGSTATDCGSPSQGLEPVDCTAEGDLGAYCVYSNHCGCTEGYVCEVPYGEEGENVGSECQPGSICVPVL